MNRNSWMSFLNRSLPIRKALTKLASNVLMYSGFILVFFIIYDLGFPENWFTDEQFFQFYETYAIIGLSAYIIKNALNIFNRDKNLRLKLIDFLLLAGFTTLYFKIFEPGLDQEILNKKALLYRWLTLPFFIVAIVVEMSRNFGRFYMRNLNPALIFVTVFMLMILLGTGFLMLPNATHDKILLIDAFFTSASAVCITGLTVVDVATTFTHFGHIVIMVLMQLGGLGIMTFAGFVGHMFSGGMSFQQQMMLRDQVSGEQLSQVVKSVYKIVLITFLIEAIGGAFIFASTIDLAFPTLNDRLFFAAFHSISAFCNSGFSTVTDGLYNVDLRFNYPLHIIICFLFIFGGIGFPIVFNFYNNIKLFLKNIFRRLFQKKRFHHVPNVITFNSKIMIYTTIILTALTFFFVLYMEFDNALAEHSPGGKLVEAFFLATTPRSAGFHTLDMGLITFPTIMVLMLMMWIGASPGGTGGGIRTTTFAVATLNFWNTARGKERIILFGREIQPASVRKAFAIISVSVIMMGLSTLLIYSWDGHLGITHILFDVFSAFNTCGLSLGVTPELSEKSKFILALTMFTGRVSALTLLSAFIFKKQFQNVRYPTAEVIY